MPAHEMEIAPGIVVVTPGWDNDELTDALRALSRSLYAHDPGLHLGSGLGGEDGYGANFENDVFVMRRFYWGECDCGAHEREEAFDKSDPGHSRECYQTELKRRMAAARIAAKAEFGVPFARLAWDQKRAVEVRVYDEITAKFGLSKYGCAVHCTCGYNERRGAADVGHRPTCSLELPNFRHKASGVEVRWYKWIGRDNQVSAPDGCDVLAAIRDADASIGSAKQ